VHIDAATRLEGDHGAPLALSDFIVGQRVKVKGDLQADGSILAEKVKLDDDDDFEVEFKGLIESIDPGASSMVVGGWQVATNAFTRFEGEHDAPLVFGDFSVGQFVEVKGILQSDGSILAKKIELEDDEREHDFELEFKGLIESIDVANSSMVVAGRQVLTNESTRFEGDDHLPLTFADFSVGQRVEVEGILQPDGSVLASKVELDDDLDDDEIEAEFKGLIESIDAANGTMVVAGHQVLTDAFTRFEGDNHLPLAFEDFSVGQFVEVEGVLQPDGTILAAKIEIKDHPLPEGSSNVQSLGTINSIDLAGDSFKVNGVLVSIGDATFLEDLFGVSLTLEDLRIGDFVNVTGDLQADGSVHSTTTSMVDQFFASPQAPENEVLGGIWTLY